MEQQRPHDPETKDELLTLLADYRRRTVLSYLRASPGDEASLRELSKRVRQQCPNDEDDVRVHLHHSALPRLDAAGVVDYDARENTVQYLGGEELEAIIDAVADC
ncbi:DUF7344 domain-containing protein [Halobacterium wangiae]|uniref:DUF7344 domain-containing protein n=1 Tax=Halobacterium wangiae TaxID=2902623 RepID=UPI001E2824F0|nr:hypothetical protein [Halobacterium wangiae]